MLHSYHQYQAGNISRYDRLHEQFYVSYLNITFGLDSQVDFPQLCNEVVAIADSVSLGQFTTVPHLLV